MSKLTRDEEESLELFVHTPAESQAGFLRLAEEITTTDGVQFGCVLDHHIIPLRPGRVMGLMARSGHGKAQPVTARVLTPAGWRCIGDLEPGDEVMNPSGGAARVVGVYPQGAKDTYTLVFSDGFTAQSCDDHLWQVQYYRHRAKDYPDIWQVKSLRDIRQDLKRPNGGAKWFVPIVKEISFPTADLPIEPYTLGILIADGGMGPSATSIMLTAPDTEVLDHVNDHTPENVTPKHVHAYDYRLSSKRGEDNKLIEWLEELGLRGKLSHEKFIPRSYLCADTSQRVALLQGLMDGDGYANPPSNSELTTSSSQLASDLAELVQSLGGTCRVKTKDTWYTGIGGNRIDCRTGYRVSITLPPSILPFRLERKLSKYTPPAKYMPSRNIRSVTLGKEDECVCIALDSENQLYITDNYAVTHNTTFGSALLLNEARRIIMRHAAERECVIHVTWEQSVEEIEAMYHATNDYSVTDISWGRVDIDRLKQDVISGDRVNLPVWVFGDSLYRSDQDTPPMTIERVYDGIRAIRKKWNMQPRLLMFDYIQDIPVPDERDRYSQVTAAVRNVSRLAVQIQCPILLGIQANQRTDDRSDPMPGMRDTEWSAVIHQKVDGMIAVMRPIRYWSPDEMPVVMIGGKEYPNCEELLAIRLLKQRGDKGHGSWGIRFNVADMTIRDWPASAMMANPRIVDQQPKRDKDLKRRGSTIQGFDFD